MSSAQEPTTWLYSETEIKSAVIEAAEQLRIGQSQTVSSFDPNISASSLHAIVRQFKTELITCEQQDIEVRSELIEARSNGSLERIDVICTRKEP
jgi:hypothetical protein